MTKCSTVIRSQTLGAGRIYVVHQVPKVVGLGARFADNARNPWLFPVNPFTGLPDVMMKQLAEDTGGGYLVANSIGRFDKDPDGRYRPDATTGRTRTRVKMFERVLEAIRRGNPIR